MPIAQLCASIKYVCQPTEVTVVTPCLDWTCCSQFHLFEGLHALQHIDDAEMYGNEEAIGQGIHESIKTGEVQREELFIVSKLGNNHHAAEAVLPAVQASLSRLQLDYLDLYHIHWCVAHGTAQCIVTIQSAPARCRVFPLVSQQGRCLSLCLVFGSCTCACTLLYAHDKGAMQNIDISLPRHHSCPCL